MSTGGEIEPAREEDAVTFAHALGSLKRHGSSLLVVGSVPDEMYVRASRQMLGDPGAERPRRRLLVVPNVDHTRAADRLRGTGPLAPEYARLISREGPARGTATVNSTGGLSEQLVPKAHFVDETLADLGSTITDVIDQFDSSARGLESAELRLGFDCLPALYAEYDPQTVFQFVHVLVTQIRCSTGIGHFHLPQSRDSDLVKTLEPLFDALIELRLDGDELKQRWHFRDTNLVSDWLSLDPQP